MKLELSRQALSFLDKQPASNKERIRLKLKSLLAALTDTGTIPFRELQIRSLSGDWKGFLRMRIGGIRIIFKIDVAERVVRVYIIEQRGTVYKMDKP